MALFSTSGQKELKRARKLASDNPSPLAFATLTEKHLMTGDTKAALKVVMEGMELFPGSDMLDRTHSSVKRSLLQDDFRELHMKLSQEPSAETMVQLARLYLETSEEAKALAMCARTIEEFPECEDAYQVVADLRMARFYNSYSVKDALIAVANLERVLTLNDQNYKAYQSLTRLCLTIGMVTKAIGYLKMMLVFSPDDTWTHEKMDQAIGLPRRDDESMESLLIEYSEQHALSAQAGRVADAAAGENPELIQLTPEQLEPITSKIDELSTRDGFLSGLLTDSTGAILHEAFAPDTEPVPLHELCTGLVEVAQRHSLRMDIGHFKRGVINGPFGQIILQTCGDITFGVLLKTSARSEPFEGEVESVAESAYVAREQAANAMAKQPVHETTEGEEQ